MKEAFTKHWPKAAILALLGVAYAAGRFMAPDKVVTVDRVVERVVEDTHAREQVRELTEQLETLRTRREVVIVTRPDGTREERTTEETERRTETERVVEVEKIVERVVTVDREVMKTVTLERARPAWRVSALGGLDIAAATRLQLVPVYGAHVERRLFGPVSAGVWGLSTGAAGLSLSIEF